MTEGFCSPSWSGFGPNVSVYKKSDKRGFAVTEGFCSPSRSGGWVSTHLNCAHSNVSI